ncbi:MAG: amidohydrolase [Armatimonadota bacterium]
MSNGWEKALDELVAIQAARQVALRRHLHANPEPSGEEYQTARYVFGALQEAGLSPRLSPSQRGVVVDVGEGEPQLGLRADMDALRVQDAKEATYRSRRVGVMHACGHDGHTAAVYGALLGLVEAKQRNLLPCSVSCRGLFQPAEETSEGARELIESGAVTGLRALLSLHMDPSRSVGRIGLRYGALTAACDSIEICVTGRGGHAARPHESIDPIAAAAQLISSIYLFVPRAAQSFDPVVVTFGQVRAGDNPNVIPERAELLGTLRTLGGASRERAKLHIQQLARGLAEVSGTRIDVTFGEGPESVVNDSGLNDLVKAAAVGVLGEESIDLIDRASMGGEDFAYYLRHVRGAMFRLGCASPTAGSSPLHSNRFDLDEQALTIGAQILARAVVLWHQPDALRSI